MIAEISTRKDKEQSLSSYATAISEYITLPENKERKEKCTAYEVYNLSDAVYDGKKFDPKAYSREINATVLAFRPNTKNPLEHHSLSFKEDLTDNKLFELAKEYLQEMRIDIDKHQVLLGIHRDSKNNHIHIAVNKVALDGTYSTMGFSNGDRLTKLHSQKVIAEMSHRHGFEQLEKNRYVIGEDGKAIKREYNKASLYDDNVSGISKKIEAYSGESNERKLKMALAGVLEGMDEGIGYAGVKESFGKAGIYMEKRKSGLVYSLDGQHYVRASVLGQEATLEGLQKYTEQQLAPATRETAPEIIRQITTNMNTGAGWQVYHDMMAAHGIRALRVGGTSRMGGTLTFVLADGKGIKDKEIAGISLLDTEKRIGSTYRQCRHYYKKFDKNDATGKAVSDAYAKGRRLNAQQRRELAERLEYIRMSKELGKMVRKQGYNPKEVSKLLSQTGKNEANMEKSVEEATLATITQGLKLMAALINDLPSLGINAQNVINLLKKDRMEQEKTAKDIEYQAKRIANRMTQDERKAIYDAHTKDLQNKGVNNEILLSGQIADRLRITGHTQSEIVMILKSGNEADDLAETSAYYAYSAKGDELYNSNLHTKEMCKVIEQKAKESCKDSQQAEKQRDGTQKTEEQAKQKPKNILKM